MLSVNVARDLLGKLLENNPKKRIKPYDALNHDWIQMHVRNKTVNPDTMLYPSVEVDTSDNFHDCMEKAWKNSISN